MVDFPAKYFFELLDSECSTKISFALSTYAAGGKDFDLVVVLSNNKKDNFLNLKRYHSILEKVKSIVKNIEKKEQLEIIVFSSFRLQNYYGDLLTKNSTNNCIKIHLLIYPTLDCFLRWESPSVVLSFLSNYTFFVGNKKIISCIKDKLPSESIKESIQPLLLLLNETYVNIKLEPNGSTIDKEVINRDSLEKLNYIKRFILWELIRHKSEKIPKTDYDSLLISADSFPELNVFLKSLRETYKMEGGSVRREYIIKLYLDYLEILSENYQLFSK